MENKKIFGQIHYALEYCRTHLVGSTDPLFRCKLKGRTSFSVCKLYFYSRALLKAQPGSARSPGNRHADRFDYYNRKKPKKHTNSIQEETEYSFSDNQ